MHACCVLERKLFQFGQLEYCFISCMLIAYGSFSVGLLLYLYGCIAHFYFFLPFCTVWKFFLDKLLFRKIMLLYSMKKMEKRCDHRDEDAIIVRTGAFDWNKYFLRLWIYEIFLYYINIHLHIWMIFLFKIVFIEKYLLSIMQGK